MLLPQLLASPTQRTRAYVLPYGTSRQTMTRCEGEFDFPELLLAFCSREVYGVSSGLIQKLLSFRDYVSAQHNK